MLERALRRNQVHAVILAALRVTEDIMLERALRLGIVSRVATHRTGYRGHHAREGAGIADC